MNKKPYTICSFCFLLLILIFIITRKIPSNDDCLQTKAPQFNWKETSQELAEYFFLKEILTYPFRIGDEQKRLSDYEEKFIEHVEDIKRSHLQRAIIADYVADPSDQAKFLSAIKEPVFYELSMEKKLEILDANTMDKAYRFWDDLVAMIRRKLYRFGEFQLALCGEFWGAWISCVNDLENPFQAGEETNNVFTGALIRKVWEESRYPLSLPQVGDWPVNLRINNGTIFLVMRVIPEGEHFGAIERNGAIYALEKTIGNQTEEFGWAFQKCYITSYKNINIPYIMGDDFPLSWYISRDYWLFMWDSRISPKHCFLGY